MRKLISIMALALVSALLPVVDSQALTLGFAPSSQTKTIGSNLSVDIVVSGLNGAPAAPQIVSAYDLDVLFDSEILGNASVDYSALEGVLGTSFDTLFYGDFISDGRIDLWALSLIDDDELNTLQGDSVTLATLNFKAIGLGTSYLTFDANTLPGIDVKGLGAAKLDFSTVDEGSVTVITGGDVPVPEPGTIILLGGGLAGLAFWRKRRS